MKLSEYIINWCEENLSNPQGTGRLQLTDEQKNFFNSWFDVLPNGQFRYLQGVYRRSKGNGKSYLAAILTLIELCIPYRAYREGELIKVKKILSPRIWICAYSESQCDNTFEACHDLLTDAPIASELDVGYSRILGLGGKIVKVTSSTKTLEGGRPTFIVADETHHWTRNDGNRMARVIKRNLDKAKDGNCRLIQFTNAHEPGENSFAEETYNDYLKAKEVGEDIRLLYDSVEAPPDTDLYDEASLRKGLEFCYKDSPWISIDRLVYAINYPSARASDSRRFYLNQIVAAEDSWLSKQELDRCVDKSLELKEQEELILGFDGARTEDSTALIGLRIKDKAFFLLGLWEKPIGILGENWEVNKEVVNGTIEGAFEKYTIKGFISDVREWENDIDQWEDKYGEKLSYKATNKTKVAYDMRHHRGELTFASEKLCQAFCEGIIKYDGNLSVTRHILNARRSPNRFGVTFRKEHRLSEKKIDILAAILLAFVMLNGRSSKEEPVKKHFYRGF